MIDVEPAVTRTSDIEFLHEISSRIAAADPFHAVLTRVVSFVSSLVQCDSCFLSVPVLSRGKLVGVINLQHRQPHEYSVRDIRLIATIGFLVGAEIEMARLEVENSQLVERLETRKVIDRAKGILQRDLGLTEEEAYLTIQRQSRQRRKTKKEIAEALILGDELRRSSGAVS